LFLFGFASSFLDVSALLQGHLSLASRPPLPEKWPIVAKISPSNLEALETVESRGEDEVEKSSEGTGSTQSPPPADFADQDASQKRKCQEDLTSSGM
jgi:hypothetical protein